MSEKSTEIVSLESKAGLLEYLKRAIALESSIITQKQVIDDYDESSRRRRPILELKKEMNTPPCPNMSSGGMILGLMGIGVFHNDWGMAIFLMVLGAALCVPFIADKAEKKATKEVYWKELERVKDANKRTKEENRAAEERYQNTIREWRDSDNAAHEYFAKSLSETQAVLDKLYSLDVIYPKYRTLPALTSIYEYLVTGRCEELSGAHGAYNLYEDEIRKDTVISQLNTVIENLEQIKQNQYMLYEQVKGIQQNTRAIAAELYQIKGYAACLTDLAALTAFYSGVAATNTSTLSYCRLLG